jgi:hypothetical protein
VELVPNCRQVLSQKEEGQKGQKVKEKVISYILFSLKIKIK